MAIGMQDHPRARRPLAGDLVFAGGREGYHSGFPSPPMAPSSGRIAAATRSGESWPCSTARTSADVLANRSVAIWGTVVVTPGAGCSMGLSSPAQAAGDRVRSGEAELRSPREDALALRRNLGPAAVGCGGRQTRKPPSRCSTRLPVPNSSTLRSTTASFSRSNSSAGMRRTSNVFRIRMRSSSRPCTSGDRADHILAAGGTVVAEAAEREPENGGALRGLVEAYQREIRDPRPRHENIFEPVNAFPDARSFEILRERRVRYVLVRVAEYGQYQRVLLERFPAYEQHLRLLADDAGVRLYEIVSWPEGPPR